MSKLDNFVDISESQEIIKMIAAKMLLKGYKTKDICELLNLSDSFIKKLKEIYENGGTEKLKYYQDNIGFITENQNNKIACHLKNQKDYINKELRDLLTLAIVYDTDKWGIHRYIPHYQYHFSHLREQAFNLLEIGVGGYDDPYKGGASLRMWKAFFPKANIFSIDIFDKSALEEPRIRIFRGSQVDPDFLNWVARQIGRIDVVIDDGSHVNEHVIFSFKTLFPL